MRRSMIAMAAAVFAAGVSVAAEPTKGGGSIQMLVAKVDGDTLATSESRQVTRMVNVTDAGGGTKTIPVTETVTTVTARGLKMLRASGPDGKEISHADLKSKLGDGGPVVFLTGPLDAEWRKKFKAGTVFVEYVAPKDEKKGEEKK
jgi:hypothetical protein